MNDPGDPRSHRYYAPRQRRVVAREATLQPVLERLRGSTRDYSADERLDNEAVASLQQPEFVIVPQRRLPVATLAAFAGGATAVAALALAYVVFGTNGGSSVAAAAPPAVQAPPTPAKIDARVAPNAPVSHVPPVQPAQTEVAAADTTAALPANTSKADRLDASSNPSAGATYDPLQSPLSLWSLSPTQAAIEGIAPALAAAGTPPSAQAADAVPPPQQPTSGQHAEHHAAPVHHHVSHRHVVRHAHHWRHHKTATTGAAGATGGAQNAPDGNAQPTATKKFLGLFGG
jgi:hypothetical protein